MSTSKRMDAICVIAVVLCFVLTITFMNGEALGLQVAEKTIGYENRLFDTSKVHTVDLTVDDWDSFLETCTNEEYTVCAAVIDGEAYKNIAIRAKGNTSLSNVASLNSQRYSFKIEFDHYDSTKSYHGLDKLSLNNIIQDNTYMKDYLAYTMMDAFGVDAPLCSYVYITVNGEDWGLYLAVEAIEDAFLLRNYGSDYGELYKPDSMSFGGGRGNGKEFDFEEAFGEDFASFFGKTDSDTETDTDTDTDIIYEPTLSDTDNGSTDGQTTFSIPRNEDGSFSMPDTDNIPSMPDMSEMPSMPETGEMPTMPDGEEGGGMGGFSGMGSDDVKLQYIDDDADSYSNIFDNAKTDISDADAQRLIASLQSLSSYENLEDVLDTDEVLRYFVVHNFVVNGDSYTGSMIHNYYLYEKDGQLSMIPWDYNLAYGTFQGGNASSSVNDAIDDVLSDRPMQAWIFSDETYTQQYHTLYNEFLTTVDIDTIIENAYTLIQSYVEKDPTKFCTYDEFTAGVSALQSFCELRTQSVAGQLNGTIGSTSEAQQTDSSTLVDTTNLNISDMGTMNNGMGGGDKGGMGGNMGGTKQQQGDGTTPPAKPDSDNTRSQENTTEVTVTGMSLRTVSATTADSSNASQPGDGNMPADMTPPDAGDMPEGMTMPEGMSMPEGMTPPDGTGGTSEQFSVDAQTTDSELVPADDSELVADVPSADTNEASSDGASASEPDNKGQQKDFMNGNMPDMGDGSAQNSQTETWILTGVSVLVLALGLLFAWKYKY